MQSSLVLFTALLAFVATAQCAAANSGVADKVKSLAKKCAAEAKVSEDKIKLAFSQEIPKDDGERCFLECCYKGLNVVEGDKYSLEGSMKLVHARFQKPEEVALATKLVETCNKEVAPKAGEKCSLGRAVRECFVKNGKTVNFFPTAH